MAKRRWFILATASVGAFAYFALRKGLLQQAGANMRTYSMPSVRVYDAIFGRLLEAGYDRFAGEVATACPAGRVLDIGCGPGRLAIKLAQIAPQLQIVGVDIERAMVDRAKRNAATKGVGERVDFVVGNVEALQFPDEQFDLVVSTFSIHHWADEVKGLSEVYRVLKPGGKALIYDLPDWLSHVERHGDGLGSAASATPFEQGKLDTAWSLGPFAVANRLVLQRPV